MGYTHYWKRARKLPKRKFKLAVDDCWEVVQRLSCPLQRTSNNRLNPGFSKSMIDFNGVGEKSYEDFVILQEDDTGGDFCKTARLPYDLAVCCCLIVFAHHFGERFEVSSDGDDEEEN